MDTIDAIPETSRGQFWHQMREEMYDAVCADTPRLREFVKLNEHRLIHGSRLPPKAQMPQPAHGEKVRRDALEYLRALTTEAEQLANLLPRLAAEKRVRRHDNYEKNIEFARCLIRFKETFVDWELETMAHRKDCEIGKEILQDLPSPEYLPAIENERAQMYREDIKVWDEGFPALERAWDELGERQLIPINI
ncbi:hypothetical protein F4821DRAFT_94118 [Hypoxylon rubiginosum]|uniref:Uncharacterized protein n=1 Tax=Hypoxylon rubiginosum TaxID=110542 RepID=A0ACC0D6K9_9PEZI|nr:hypothetical protein F4821DRAFT_94118 [Hypoxylon rubiginosum]